MKTNAMPTTASGGQTRARTPLPSSEPGAKSTSEAAEEAFREAIRSWQRLGLDERDFAHSLIMKLLMRIEVLFGRIEEAFASQPFLPCVPPDSAASQSRFNAYATDCGRAAKLLEFALELSKVARSMSQKPNASESEKSRCDT